MAKQNGKTNGHKSQETNDKSVVEQSTVNVSAANTLAEIDTLVGRGDKEISALIGDILHKSNEVKAGPVTTLVTLCRIYGDNLAEHFPRPVENADAEKGVNGPHEFFEAPKKQKDGTSKMSKCNFFTEFWGDTSKGKSQQYVLSQIALFGTPDESKAEQKYKDMPAEKLANLKKKTTNDKSAGRSLIRRAVGVWYVMADLQAYAERCSLAFAMDVDDVEALAASQYPLDLIDHKRTRKYRPMSVGDVLKLDVKLAVATAGDKGNLYDALVAQLARGAGDTETAKATFANIAECFNAFIQINNYLDTATEQGRDHFATIKNQLAKKGQDDMIEAVGDAIDNMKQLWSEPFQVRYARIKDKRIAAANVEETKAA